MKRNPHHDHPGPGPPSGWDHVAAWYDRLVGEEGSDYHRRVILPAAVRLLVPHSGESFIDVCCGQGVLCRALLEREAGRVLGVDASARLIDAAIRHGRRDPRAHYVVRDAAKLGELADGTFDAAACIMALQDLAELEAAIAGMAAALRPGGRLVMVMMHPCFRVPRQSEWGWDEAKKTQYRRIDRYATPMQVPIATHPGSDPGVKTVFHHRPLAAYLNALASAGLCLDTCEELLTHRSPPPGPRHEGLTRSMSEIPVFLALRAVKPSAAAAAGSGNPESGPEAPAPVHLGGGRLARPRQGNLQKPSSPDTAKGVPHVHQRPIEHPPANVPRQHRGKPGRSGGPPGGFRGCGSGSGRKGGRPSRGPGRRGQ